MSNKSDFRTFRNNLHHEINNKSMEEMILDIIESDSINQYYKINKPLQALYLLSLLDTFCIELNLPIVSDYDKIRNLKFEKPVIIGDQITKDSTNIYPEFLKHNIYEGDLYDAI